MALLTLYYDNTPETVCIMAGTPSSGMATMYLMMCIVHLSPWLKLLSYQRIRDTKASQVSCTDKF
jgi:hypothetical protein